MPSSKRRPILHDIATIPGCKIAHILDRDSAIVRIDPQRFARHSADDRFWDSENQPLGNAPIFRGHKKPRVPKKS